MLPKERVYAALQKRPTDRVPIFMWFHPETRRRLASLLEIPEGHVAEAMGDDIRQTWVNNNYAMEGIAHEREGASHVDFWGIEWRREGAFNQAVAFPLAGKDADTAREYRFPADKTEFLLNRMLPVLETADRFFIGVDVSPCVFEMYWRLRGMERALCDMASDSVTADTLLGRCADFSILLSVAASERFALDWLWLGDDVAGQQGLIMSPAMWRALVKPHLARVAAVGLRHGLPVAFHCCGALRDIIPDLIEIGISVLNPIQCNCPGMDPRSLKREFGDRLSFMGGVDTQGLLVTGTAAQVRRATEALIEDLTADGGGYILAASHTVPPETTDENIFAMYAAAGLGRERICDAAADIRKRLEATL